MNEESENEDNEFTVELDMTDEEGHFIRVEFDCLEDDDICVCMSPSEAKALAFQLLTVAAAAEEASALLQNEGLE